MSARRRPTATRIENAWAKCRDCHWSRVDAGALGAAAMHHDETKHEVEARQTLRVRYGLSKLTRGGDRR